MSCMWLDNKGSGTEAKLVHIWTTVLVQCLFFWNNLPSPYPDHGLLVDVPRRILFQQNHFFSWVGMCSVSIIYLHTSKIIKKYQLRSKTLRYWVSLYANIYQKKKEKRKSSSQFPWLNECKSTCRFLLSESWYCAVSAKGLSAFKMLKFCKSHNVYPA